MSDKVRDMAVEETGVRRKKQVVTICAIVETTCKVRVCPGVGRSYAQGMRYYPRFGDKTRVRMLFAAESKT
jgi:hypothetical protein